MSGSSVPVPDRAEREGFLRVAWRHANSSWVNRALTVGGVAVLVIVTYALYSRDVLSLQVFGVALTIYFAVLVMLKNNEEVRLATKQQVDAMQQSTAQQMQTTVAEYERVVAGLDRVSQSLAGIAEVMNKAVAETQAVKQVGMAQLAREQTIDSERLARVRPIIFALLQEVGPLFFRRRLRWGRFHVILVNRGVEAQDVVVQHTWHNPNTRQLETRKVAAAALRQDQPLTLDCGGIVELERAGQPVVLTIALRDIDKRPYQGSASIQLTYQELVEVPLAPSA